GGAALRPPGIGQVAEDPHGRAADRRGGIDVPAERRVTASSDRNLGALELAIGRVLRIGVAASTVCLAAGLLLTLAGLGGRIAQAVLLCGLLILLATPAARVVVSIVEYVRERDWLFAALTLTVLLTLVGSVVVAFWN